ncbi:MAG: Vitamin transporter BtuB precursor [Pseudomonadota bacterium]
MAGQPATAAPSGAEVKELGQVVVRAERASDEEQRRESTATRIVIGREELERQGDASIAEVLKRQPGITLGGAPGRGGAPRMRGMGGYTQILLDGQRVPPGFAVESLTPEMVERIEILRAPTAETGARAVAGTINIVLREGLRAQPDELKLGLGSEHGRLSENGTWVHPLRGEALQGLVSLALADNRRASDTLAQTRHDSGQGYELDKHAFGDGSTRSLHAMGRMQWSLGGGESLVLMPFAVRSLGANTGSLQLAQRFDAGAVSSEQAATASDSQFSMLRLNGQWNRRLDPDSRLESRLGVGTASYDYRYGRSGGTTLLSDLVQSQAFTDRSFTAGAKLSRVLRDDQLWVSGFEWEQVRRQEDGNADGTDRLQARTGRLAFYSQDEWSLNPQWSAHAGLRYEGIVTAGNDAAGAQRNASAVWTPLLHALWRPVEGARDQWRMSLTRSYKTPTLNNLLAHTTLSRDLNSPTAPDRSGNPGLRPELATGLELGYEHYPSAGGVLGANLFRRDITDLIRTLVALDPASQRWVARPQNVGDAVTQGLELEAKLALRQWWPQAPLVDLRGNLSFYHSRVEGVPGPDNRLDRQPGRTANLGGDYRLAGLPLTLGGNVSFNPSYASRLSAEQSAWQDMKRVLDLYALWRYSPTAAMRLSVSNALPRDYATASAYASPALSETQRSSERSWRAVQLRFEFKL